MTLTPLEQTEVAVDADPRSAATASGRSEVWQRDKSALAVDRTHWLHLYQFRDGRGQWENMFLPNGAGTVEWHLGWAAEIPRGYFLLVTAGDGPAGLEIPTGVLSSTSVARMNTGPGIGIAVRPSQRITIERGQELARLILLHADSLQATAEHHSYDGTDQTSMAQIPEASDAR